MTRLIPVLALTALFPLTAAAQAPPDVPRVPVVITTGEGMVKSPPDRAWVTIAAESRAKSPREAQRMNAEAMSAVMAKLKGTGLPEDAIETRAYELRPEFDYRDGKQTLRGYVARNTIEVRLDDIARVGEIVDLAVGSGATSVGGIRFDLKNRDRLEQEALRLAVEDARRRADAAAAGAGMKVTEILRIDEQRQGSQPPQPMMMRQDAMAAEAVTPVSPGEVEVRARVSVTAAIK